MEKKLLNTQIVRLMQLLIYDVHVLQTTPNAAQVPRTKFCSSLRQWFDDEVNMIFKIT